MAKVSSEALENYYLVEDSQMPNENTMVGPLRATSLEQCAVLCERHNEMLAGSYANDGSISTGYSYEHCNAFVYDRERQLCTLKNKRMGNFYPQQGDAVPACAFYDGGSAARTGHASKARYVSGYRWDSLINEVNTSFPNMTSGMQYWKANPTWSTDNWGVTNNHCTTGTSGPLTGCKLPYCPESVLKGRGVSLKPVGYDVRPGAIISSKNVTTGPLSFVHDSEATAKGVVKKFPVKNMQQCADMAARRAQEFGPYTGVNAWTFHPDYDIEQATNTPINQRDDWSGTCSLGHVREPYYQTLTPSDNGAISGFALTSLSREVQRFLFGEMK